MAEVVISPHVRFRSNLIDAHASMKVWLWDLGPEKPTPPQRPDAPRGKQGDPLFDLATIEFREKIEAYEAALKTFKRETQEFTDWQTKNGGPVEQMFWSCDARDCLQHDRRAVSEGRQAKPRWFLSSRTRGYANLPNRGLPPGAEPGHGHEQNLARQLADDESLARARQADPVFGEFEGAK